MEYRNNELAYNFEKDTVWFENIYEDYFLNRWYFFCGEPINKGIQYKFAVDDLKDKMFIRGYKLINFSFYVALEGKSNHYKEILLYPFKGNCIKFSTGTISFG